MNRTIFIGDVHGCREELTELLALLELVPGADRVIFVGDLVDKGPDSLGVLRDVLQLTISHPGSVVVSGNHEEKASRFAKRGTWVEPWAEEATEEDWAFIDAMPLTWHDPKINIRVVHGGIFPILLEKHPNAFAEIEKVGNAWRKGGGKLMDRARRMLRTRFVSGPHRPTGVRGEVRPGEMLSLGENKEGDPFWAETFKGPELVIYGHSPFLDGQARLDQYAMGIDTGCVFGVKLTAWVCYHSPVAAGHFVQVDARARYAKPLKED